MREDRGEPGCYGNGTRGGIADLDGPADSLCGNLREEPFDQIDCIEPLSSSQANIIGLELLCGTCPEVAHVLSTRLAGMERGPLATQGGFFSRLIGQATEGVKIPAPIAVCIVRADCPAGSPEGTLTACANLLVPEPARLAVRRPSVLFKIEPDPVSQVEPHIEPGTDRGLCNRCGVRHGLCLALKTVRK